MSDREPPPGFPHLSTSVFLEQQVGDAPRPTKWPFHMFDCRRTADGNYIIQLVIPKGEPVPALSGITTLKRELTGTNNQTWKVTEHWLNHLLEVVRDRESSGTEPELRTEESAWFHSFHKDSLNTKTIIADWWDMIRKSTCIEDLVTVEGIVERLKLAVQ